MKLTYCSDIVKHIDTYNKVRRFKEMAMSEKKVTLKDIARHCDLAPTTVSRILRDKSTYCSAAKIAMVKEIAKKWNYSPNIGYRIMTGGVTNIAAIIFSQERITQNDQLNRLYMQLSSGLDRRSFASYTAIMGSDLSENLNKIRDLDERGCRYYIFIGTPLFAEEIMAYLFRNNRRCVGYSCSECKNGMVNSPEIYLKYLEISEKEGRKNFKIASTPGHFKQHILPVLKQRSANDDFSSLLYPISPVGVVSGNSSEHYFELGKIIMKEALTADPAIDAMVFSSDYHVFGAAQALCELGKEPESVRLFGIGDAVASRFAGVDFITSRNDVEAGAEKILDHLKDDDGEWFEYLSGEVVHYCRKSFSAEK